MYAINKQTGAKIKGTLENLQGCANTVEDGFRLDEDGKLVHEYEGYTVIFWDNSTTASVDGEPVYLDSDNDEISLSEIVLVADDPDA